MSHGIQLAAQHDAEGRYDEAVNALAVATREGDIEAMTELGKRLVVGYHAPFLPRDGTGLLADATRGGSAEAAMRLACLSALGAHAEQSWSRALGLLAHAAELGSDSARGQLYLLAGREGAAPESEDWRALAGEINLVPWLTPPSTGKVLNDVPRVAQFSDFVPDALCTWLIERARNKLQRAMIYSGDAARDVTDEMRTNSVGVMHLGNIDVINVIVQYRIAATCRTPVSHLDSPVVLHYAVGEQIKDHYDYINPSTPNYEYEIQTRGERLITFLVYLNDDYEGGETDFPKLGCRHKGRRGDGLFFVNALPDDKPDARMAHAGLPPTSGEKWLLSQFIRNKPSNNTPAESLP